MSDDSADPEMARLLRAQAFLDDVAHHAATLYRAETGHGNLIGDVEREIRRVLPSVVRAFADLLPPSPDGD